MSHPNRSKKRNKPGATPLPEQIKELRESAGMTLREFAKMGFYSERAAAEWEAGERKMHPLAWMTYQQMIKELVDNRT